MKLINEILNAKQNGSIFESTLSANLITQSDTFKRSERVIKPFTNPKIILFFISLFAVLGCNSSSHEDLGSYDDPKVALIETQKVFTMLSKNVNKGYESMYYINEYEIAKDKMFNVD